VIPTGTGDVAVVCQVAKPGASLNDCTTLARQIKLSGASTLKPGADKPLAALITKQLQPAVKQRAAIGTLDSSTLSARAAGARSAAAADVKAAKAIARIQVPPRYRPQVVRLTTALRSESVALTSLAKAATADDRTAYANGVKVTDAASRRATSAAAALTTAGITLPKVSAFALDGPPALPAPSSTASNSSSTSIPPTNQYTAPTTTPAPTTPAPTTPAPTTPSPTTPSPPTPSPGGGPNCSNGCTVG
jgi:hypothetical protein